MPPLHLHAFEMPDGAAPIDLWVVDGRISRSAVADAESLPHAFVAPGLVDAHVHLTIDWSVRQPQPRASEVVDNARRHAAAGVLAVRDAGYVPAYDIDAVSLPPEVHVERSGWMVTPPGRFWPGVDAATWTEPDQLVRRVDEVADAGLSWFKFIGDFPGTDFDLLAAPPTFDAATVRAAVERAHARGLRVMAHSTGPTMRDLVDAGVDSIEHGMGVTPDIVEAMASRGTAWVPTIACIREFLLMTEAQGAPTARRADWEARLRTCLPLAVERGVDVPVGTDEQPHGTIVTEMLAMAEYGLDARQVVRAATVTGRRLLGLPGLEDGAPADLVLYDDDPREDLTALRRPAAVLVGGVPVQPARPVG